MKSTDFPLSSCPLRRLRVEAVSVLHKNNTDLSLALLIVCVSLVLNQQNLIYMFSCFPWHLYSGA